MMDVRAAKVDPVVEHDGSCTTYFMVPKGSVRPETEGGFLDFVSEFEVKRGSRLQPHCHDTHEYYYVMHGTAVMQIEAEQRLVSPGDLVHIPRNAVHSIWPVADAESVRALAFSIGFQAEGVDYVPAELPPPDEVA
jgi:quercetin dioxygenase-like cupin family protein